VFENGVYPLLDTGLRRLLSLQDESHEALLRALGAELRWAGPFYVGPPKEEAPFPCVASYPASRVLRNIWGTWDGPETYADLYERPFRGVETVAEVEAHRWPDPNWFDYSRVTHFSLPQGCSVSLTEWAVRNSDYARIVSGWNPIFARMMDVCGFERGLINIAARPDLTHAIVGRIGEFYEEFYRRLARAARGHADFLGFGDDFADQRGLLLSPHKWREYFLPVWKRLFAIGHENGLKPFMHMCGAVRPVLGDLIDAGLEVYEVTQVTARGMDPVELKREFGEHLTFYGGISTQYTLPYGTVEDVRREVRERIEVMARGGRYILASMHFLMDDVPPENVLAMYEEARSYRPSWAA
jgi:uroporphyrinogen decarboxylase